MCEHIDIYFTIILSDVATLFDYNLENYSYESTIILKTRYIFRNYFAKESGVAL